MALLIASGLGAGGHAAPLPPFLLLPRARDCALYAGGRALEAVRDARAWLGVGVGVGVGVGLGVGSVVRVGVRVRGRGRVRVRARVALVGCILPEPVVLSDVVVCVLVDHALDDLARVLRGGGGGRGWGGGRGLGGGLAGG